MSFGRVSLLAAVVSTCVFVLLAPAQSQRSGLSSVLSAQEKAGKKVFVQRCSVCHLPPLGPTAEKPFGPQLNGYIKGAENEARARNIIRNGASGMPGFQYGLEPQEIENLVVYMRTLK